MAVAVDASTPAIAKGTTSATSAAFTPPAGAILLATVTCNQASGDTLTADPAISSSAGLTWHKIGVIDSRTSAQKGIAYAAWAVVAESASMTVTATKPASSTHNGTDLQVVVVTGANTASAIGQSGTGTNAAGKVSSSYAAGLQGSMGFLVNCDWEAEAAPTVAAGTTLISTIAEGTTNWVRSWNVRETATAGAAGETVTIGASNSIAKSVNNWVYFEVLPAAVIGSLYPLTPASVSAGAKAATSRVLTSPDGKTVYSANYLEASVTLFKREADGTLKKVESYACGANPEDLCIEPEGKDLYVACRGSNKVVRFARNTSTGVLSGKEEYAAGSEPIGLGITPDGKSVYAALAGEAKVAQYEREASGKLKALSPATVAAGTNVHAVAVHPNNKYAYVANYGTGTVGCYEREASGKLKALAGHETIASGTNPHGLTFDPTGKHLYVACNEESGHVHVFSCNEGTGVLTAVETVAAGNYSESVAIHPSGEYAYVVNEGISGTESTYLISQFSRDTSTGKLTALSPATVKNAGFWASSLSVSPDGLNAYGNCGPVATEEGLVSQFGIATAIKAPTGSGTAAGNAPGVILDDAAPTGSATGAGVAPGMVLDESAPTGAATGSGVAPGVSDKIAAPTGSASGSGVAPGIPASVTVPTGSATGAGVAPTEKISDPAPVGSAKAAGVAPGVKLKTAVPTGSGTAAGVAPGVVLTVPRPAISVRERPPLWTAVMAEPVDGHNRRWGHDEPDPAYRISGYTHSSSVPGGFDQMSCVLKRKPGTDFPDLARLTPLRSYGAGGETLWEGRLTNAPSVSGDDMAITPAAVGWKTHLEDDNTASMIFIDEDLSRWTGPSTERQVALNGVNKPVQGAPSAEWSGEAPVLAFTLNGGWLSPMTPRIEGWYDAGAGNLIAAIYGSFAGWPDANFILEVRVADDAKATHEEKSADLYAGSPGSIAFTPTARYRHSLIVWVYNATPAGAESGQYEARLSGLKVIGDHGLTAQGSGESMGFLASDAIPFAVSRWAPLLKIGDNIYPTNFAIRQLAFYSSVNVAQMIEEANKYHLYDWAVWDNREFCYYPRGAIGRKWLARVGPSKLRATGPSSDRVFNGVIVRYQDVDGTTRTVGPPGSGADVEDASLEDTDPENPANQTGIKRIGPPLEMGTVSVSGAAIQVGARYLEEARALDRSGQAELVGTVYDDHGIEHPVSHVRGGDTITFTDAADTSARRIVQAHYDGDSYTAAIDLDGPPEGMSAILARLGLAVSGIGG